MGIQLHLFKYGCPMNTNMIKILSFSISALLLTACGDNSTQAPTGTGVASLNVTDAPVDYAEAVVVEFSSVTLKSDDEDDIVFDFDEPKSIDLLQLQGMHSQPLFENEEIPSGNYSQIRLGVNAEFDDVMDSYITIDGTQYELRVPSGSQSGLKLNQTFTVEDTEEGTTIANADSVYTIDFDLRKSIVDAVGQPGYFLKPVLRLVQNTNTGSISGTVDATLLTGDNCSDEDPLTGNAVYLFAGADVTPDDFDEIESEPLTSALVSFDEGTGIYSYEIGYLAEASYTLAFTCAADLDDEEDNATVIFDIVDNVDVLAATNTDHPVD